MRRTPMLQQYLELKERHRDALLLYRLGDFYELFFEDAERAAPVLGIVLTRRRHNDEVTSPMCGVPHHALAAYVGKLLDAGFRVAIAEQVEDPATAGGLVRREVVRALSPGTVTEPELLADAERRWIVAVAGGGRGAAVAWLEASSGEFGGVAVTGEAELREVLAQLKPREVLLPERSREDGAWLAELGSVVVTFRPDAWFEAARAEQVLRGALGVGSLRAFDLEPGEPLVGAAGALVEYLRVSHGAEPRHLSGFERRRDGGALVLDASTVRNLELLRAASGDRRAALAQVLDHTVTAMGARTLREWLLRPLGDPAAAELRHGAVAALIDDPAMLLAVRDRLRQLGDLERAAARVGLCQCRPGELVALRNALPVLPKVGRLLRASASRLLASLGAAIDVLDDLRGDLERTIADEPPALPGPGMIRAGVDAELDEARSLARGAKEALAEMEARERAATGIANLRVRYNRVFGYGFEVSRVNLERVPAGWTRRQTLAGAERFTTSELEDIERRIASAETDAEAREAALYRALLERAAAHAARLAGTARALAEADVLACFADRARRKGYVRPRLVTGANIRLRASRHPVIEEISSSAFVPNDVELEGSSRQIVLLTGPNMGGKSTYLRQVALAVVMARAGSYVAAEAAEIGQIDRIFTRVGAADDIARGESTFMVEMTEVASILRRAGERSLVILDEVGRGTATFDGLSLAWSVVEALHDHRDGGRGPLVLFATHYHELTDLADRLERVANASVAVKEWQGQVIFLHRVVPGPSDRSYGIHVARLAGVPAAVCARAQEVLATLERQELRVLEEARPERAPHQLTLFPSAEAALLGRLRTIDTDRLTPLEALRLLADLKTEVGP
ncbi:MAG: DNA mismatch repair protein MutS [Acidobacteriota bacterium]